MLVSRLVGESRGGESSYRQLDIRQIQSGINDVVLVGAGTFFLLTLESRIKRRRSLEAINELRAIAHTTSRTSRTAWPSPR